MVTVNDIQDIVTKILVAQMWIPSIVSFFMCLVFVLLTPSLFKLFQRQQDANEVQAAHDKPTLRIGGLGLLFGILSSIVLLKFTTDFVVYASFLLCSAIPLILTGFSEDIGYRVHPKIRLASIALSSLLCTTVLNVSVTSVGVAWVDMALSHALVSIIFTIFAASGVTNAFNLIDGLNGLASFTAIRTGFAIAAIAMLSGVVHLQNFYIMLAIVTFGFFLLNYPFGRLFLGDGGAYLLGHCLVWGGITLTHEISGLSAFSILLIFFWPVADTVLAIWRRMRLARPADRPDRMHFHQLVMRFLEIRFLGRNRRQLANPLATLIIAPLIVSPQICGLIYAFDNKSAMIASACFAVIFFMTYSIGMHVAPRTHKVGRAPSKKALR